MESRHRLTINKNNMNVFDHLVCHSNLQWLKCDVSPQRSSGNYNVNIHVFMFIIPLCKHVVARVTLVPRSVYLTGKRDKVGHGEVTINSARIIDCILSRTLTVYDYHKLTCLNYDNCST